MVYAHRLDSSFLFFEVIISCFKRATPTICSVAFKTPPPRRIGPPRDGLPGAELLIHARITEATPEYAGLSLNR